MPSGDLGAPVGPEFLKFKVALQPFTPPARFVGIDNHLSSASDASFDVAGRFVYRNENLVWVF